MRIISGRFRGRTLKAPKGQNTRPTVDRVREAIASSVISAHGGPVEGPELDVFAGSGALGFEMLSRGASSCLFFDSDRRAQMAVLDNIKALGLSRDEARLRKDDCIAAIKAGSIASHPFEAVMLDPPYKLPATEVFALVEALAEHGDLAEECVVVYEHHADSFDAESEMPATLAGRQLELHAQKRYGIVGVTIFTL